MEEGKRRGAGFLDQTCLNKRREGKGTAQAEGHKMLPPSGETEHVNNAAISVPYSVVVAAQTQCSGHQSPPHISSGLETILVTVGVGPGSTAARCRCCCCCAVRVRTAA